MNEILILISSIALLAFVFIVAVNFILYQYSKEKMKGKKLSSKSANSYDLNTMSNSEDID